MHELYHEFEKYCKSDNDFRKRLEEQNSQKKQGNDKNSQKKNLSQDERRPQREAGGQMMNIEQPRNDKSGRSHPPAEPRNSERGFNQAGGGGQNKGWQKNQKQRQWKQYCFFHGEEKGHSTRDCQRNSGEDQHGGCRLAYFLVGRGAEDEDDYDMEADSIAVFDMATEEWKPATLRGPLTSSLVACTDKVVPTMRYRRHPDPWWYSITSLRKRFQLARLGDNLVVVYCNVEENSTELWFLEDMDDDDDDDTAPRRWSRRYTLQCTPVDKKTRGHYYFRISASVQQYHYPLEVLEDGRILVWVDTTSALRAYDIETCAWTDLATLTGDCVVGMHHGSLVCSSLAWGAGTALSLLRLR